MRTSLEWENPADADAAEDDDVPPAPVDVDWILPAAAEWMTGKG